MAALTILAVSSSFIADQVELKERQSAPVMPNLVSTEQQSTANSVDTLG